MNVAFRLYASEDRMEVLQMMSSFNQIDGYEFDLKMGEDNLLDFTSNQTLGRLYMIQVEQQIAGYVVLTFGFSFEYKGRDAFIDEFYLKDAYRSQGIGKLTMDFIEEEARKLNVKAIHLEVEPHNDHANRLYLNKGYRSGNRILMTKRIESSSKS